MKNLDQNNLGARNFAADCPICRKSNAAKYRPFCSKRCADLDLGRWLNETYRVPVDDDESLQDSDAGTVSATQSERK